MGTIGTYRQPGLTDLEYFTSAWPDALGEGGYWKVIAQNSTRDGWYAAIEDTRREEGTDGRFFVLVVSKNWTPRSQSENFYYKDMEEDMGPCQIGASLAVVNSTPEPTNAYAIEWRRQVRAAREQERAIKKNLRHGTKLTFPRKLHFADNVEEDHFLAFKRHDGKLGYRRASDYCVVRLPQGWKSWTGTTIEAPADA